MTKYNTDICEIYIIWNSINEKLYVGQSWGGAEKRFKEHKRDKNGKCPKLFNAMDAHGRGNFFVIAVASCKTQSDADFIETHLIEELNAIEYGYNCKTEGSGGRLSEETKRKIGEANSGKNNYMFGKIRTDSENNINSESNKGRIPWNKGLETSEATKIKLSQALKGRAGAMVGKTHSQETLDKMSESHKGHTSGMTGKKHSDEAKLKMTKSKTGKKVNRKKKIKPAKIKKVNLRFTGKIHSVTTKKKQSEAKLGKIYKKHSQEARDKRSQLNTGEANPFFGKRHTEESKQKNREAHSGKNSVWFGKTHSEETKQKMRDTSARKKLAKQMQDFYSKTIYFNLNEQN